MGSRPESTDEVGNHIAGTFGTALLLSLGLDRIARTLSLYKMLALLYAAVFLLAFDATNARTRVMAIPFILAIALGNSQVKKANEDSSKGGFGLIVSFPLVRSSQ